MDEKSFRKRAQELCAQLTREEKLGLISTHNFPVERLGLGEFFIGTEVARGWVGREPDKISTVFPQPVGLAATFDRKLMFQLGEIAGKEARAYYNEDKRSGLALWGPTVDMVRDPRWGRTEEAYGEDVFLAGELTAAYTLGMAGENEDGFYMTVPTLKHFCANNNEDDRIDCDAYLPPRLRHEYYYSAFENAIRNGGARSIMAAYNELNGVPAVIEPDIKAVLKDQWGLWFAVTDGGDFSQTVTAHHYTDSFAEAYKLTIRGGCDAMTDEAEMVRHAAETALDEGLISEREIDTAVTNILYARLRLGQLDKTPFDDISKEVIDCKRHRVINRRAAAEQLVLLKNNGILPLSGKEKKIAVVGALADECLRDWYTGYFSYRSTVLSALKEKLPEVHITHDTLWDKVKIKTSDGRYIGINAEGMAHANADEQTAAVFELQNWGENWCNFFSAEHGKYLRLFDDNTIKLHNSVIYDWFTRETFNIKHTDKGAVIEEFLHHRRLTALADGTLTVKRSTAVRPENTFFIETISGGVERAEKLAAENDLVIYCVGNHPVQTAKECYDRKTLSLNVQPHMTERLSAANPNTVLMLISSYPYGIVTESEAAAAVIWSSHAGAELGNVVADLIIGSAEPVGRLPLTWYKSELDLPEIHDYDIETAGSTYMYFEGEPLFPFGYGLSYSAFTYSEPEILRTYDGLKATLIVTNDSDRDGTETIQLYFTMTDSEVSRPKRKLCGFTKAFIPAHESRLVTVDVPFHILRVFDVRRREMIVEEGEYLFMFGHSSEDICEQLRLHIKGETIAPRDSLFPAAYFDSAEGIRIRKLPESGMEYIYVTGWNGKAVYSGLDISGKTQLRVTASGVFGSADVHIKLGSAELVLSVKASDKLDAFDEYILPIPDGTTGDTLEIDSPANVNICEIELR